MRCPPLFSLLVSALCLWAAFLATVEAEDKPRRSSATLDCHADAEQRPIQLTPELALLAGDVINFRANFGAVSGYLSPVQTADADDDCRTVPVTIVNETSVHTQFIVVPVAVLDEESIDTANDTSSGSGGGGTTLPTGRNTAPRLVSTIQLVHARDGRLLGTRACSKPSNACNTAPILLPKSYTYPCHHSLKQFNSIWDLEAHSITPEAYAALLRDRSGAPAPVSGPQPIFPTAPGIVFPMPPATLPPSPGGGFNIFSQSPEPPPAQPEGRTVRTQQAPGDTMGDPRGNDWCLPPGGGARMGELGTLSFDDGAVELERGRRAVSTAASDSNLKGQGENGSSESLSAEELSLSAKELLAREIEAQRLSAVTVHPAAAAASLPRWRPYRTRGSESDGDAGVEMRYRGTTPLSASASSEETADVPGNAVPPELLLDLSSNPPQTRPSAAWSAIRKRGRVGSGALQGGQGQGQGQGHGQGQLGRDVHTQQYGRYGHQQGRHMRTQHTIDPVAMSADTGVPADIIRRDLNQGPPQHQYEQQQQQQQLGRAAAHSVPPEDPALAAAAAAAAAEAIERERARERAERYVALLQRYGGDTRALRAALDRDAAKSVQSRAEREPAMEQAQEKKGKEAGEAALAAHRAALAAHRAAQAEASAANESALTMNDTLASNATRASPSSNPEPSPSQRAPPLAGAQWEYPNNPTPNTNVPAVTSPMQDALGQVTEDLTGVRFGTPSADNLLGKINVPAVSQFLTGGGGQPGSIEEAAAAASAKASQSLVGLDPGTVFKPSDDVAMQSKQQEFLKAHLSHLQQQQLAGQPDLLSAATPLNFVNNTAFISLKIRPLGAGPIELVTPCASYLTGATVAAPEYDPVPVSLSPFAAASRARKGRVMRTASAGRPFAGAELERTFVPFSAVAQPANGGHGQGQDGSGGGSGRGQHGGTGSVRVKAATTGEELVVPRAAVHMPRARVKGKLNPARITRHDAEPDENAAALAAKSTGEEARRREKEEDAALQSARGMVMQAQSHHDWRRKMELMGNDRYSRHTRRGRDTRGDLDTIVLLPPQTDDDEDDEGAESIPLRQDTTNSTTSSSGSGPLLDAFAEAAREGRQRKTLQSGGDAGGSIISDCVVRAVLDSDGTTSGVECMPTFSACPTATALDSSTLWSVTRVPFSDVPASSLFVAETMTNINYDMDYATINTYPFVIGQMALRNFSPFEQFLTARARKSIVQSISFRWSVGITPVVNIAFPDLPSVLIQPIENLLNQLLAPVIAFLEQIIPGLAAIIGELSIPTFSVAFVEFAVPIVFGGTAVHTEGTDISIAYSITAPPQSHIVGRGIAHLGRSSVPFTMDLARRVHVPAGVFGQTTGQVINYDYRIPGVYDGANLINTEFIVDTL